MKLARAANIVRRVGDDRRRLDDELNIVGKNRTCEDLNGRRRRALCRRTQGIFHTDANVSPCRRTSISWKHQRITIYRARGIIQANAQPYHADLDTSRRWIGPLSANSGHWTSVGAPFAPARCLVHRTSIFWISYRHRMASAVSGRRRTPERLYCLRHEWREQDDAPLAFRFTSVISRPGVGITVHPVKMERADTLLHGDTDGNTEPGFSNWRFTCQSGENAPTNCRSTG